MTQMEARLDAMEKDLREIGGEMRGCVADLQQQIHDTNAKISSIDGSMRETNAKMSTIDNSIEQIQTLLQDILKDRRGMESGRVSIGTSSMNTSAMKYKAEQGIRKKGKVDAEVDSIEENIFEDDDYKRNAEHITIPEFDGSDPVQWLTFAEHYFEVQHTRPDRKVPLASMLMRGHSVYWFKMLTRRIPQLDWPMLKQELLLRYGSLSTLRQISSIATSVKEFEAIPSSTTARVIRDTPGNVDADITTLRTAAALQCSREKMDVIDLGDETIDAEVLNSMAVTNEYFQTTMGDSNPSALSDNSERKKQKNEKAEAIVDEDRFRFLNSAVGGVIIFGPHELLCEPKIIEKDLGCTSGISFGPGPIDLDILFYGKFKIRSNICVVPSERIWEKPFVLAPLIDLCGTEVDSDTVACWHSLSGKSGGIHEWWKSWGGESLIGKEGVKGVLPLGDLLWDWAERTSIMGVLHLTPNRFSDGGMFQSVEAAVSQNLRKCSVDILEEESEGVLEEWVEVEGEKVMEQQLEMFPMAAHCSGVG